MPDEIMNKLLDFKKPAYNTDNKGKLFPAFAGQAVAPVRLSHSGGRQVTCPRGNLAPSLAFAGLSEGGAIPIPSTRDRDLTCHPYSQAPSSDLRRLVEGDAKTAPAEAGQAHRAVY
jgi:hypothetical protein